jgi:hypothetical protein
MNDIELSLQEEELKYPQCSCGADTEQVYDQRQESEGYFVMRGKNW